MTITTPGNVTRIIECETAGDAVQILTGIDLAGERVAPARMSGERKFKPAHNGDNGKPVATAPAVTATERMCELCHQNKVRSDNKGCESCSRKACGPCRSKTKYGLCVECVKYPEQ